METLLEGLQTSRHHVQLSINSPPIWGWKLSGLEPIIHLFYNSSFRSTPPNLGMETSFPWSKTLPSCLFPFDQLPPIWGWKRFSGVAIAILPPNVELSINSPQSGDGNKTLFSGTSWFQNNPTFDQLPPIWGWKPPETAAEPLWLVPNFRSTPPNLGMETTIW